MFRKISRDIKIAALNLHESDVLALPNILACVGFSVVEGSMKQDGFLQFLENQVVCLYPPIIIFRTKSVQLPLCSPLPGPLSVLVMDNACIHHSDEIVELIEQYDMP